MKLLLPSLLFCLATSAFANLLNEIPAGQRTALAQGQTIVRQIPVAGAPWPELKLFRIVKAPPQVVSSLFTDYEAGPSYLPNLVAARVVSTNPDGSVDVEYTAHVPFLNVVDYTVQDTVTKKGNETTVSWKLLKSPLVKSSDGSLSIEPYGKNHTLMCYTNLCVPILDFIIGLQSEALNEAKVTVNAIATEAERRAKGGPIAHPSPSPAK